MSGPLIDRRSALKKAAAAGAIAAWTAPIVTSTTAHAANGICTAKCAGVPIVCFVFQTGGGGSCTTWDMISMTLLRNSSCGCGGNDAAGCLTIPALMSFTGTSAVSAVTNTTTGAFSLTGLTAGNGSWTATTPFVASTFCLDRNGDKVWRTCTYRITLDKVGCTRAVSAFGKLCAAPSSVCIADPCAGVVSSMVTTCVTNPNFAPTDAGTDPSVVLPVSASARG